MVRVGGFRRVTWRLRKSVVATYMKSHFRLSACFCTQDLKPHIFIVAEDAYRNVRGQLEPVNQSLVVSGESGAGKVNQHVLLISLRNRYNLLHQPWAQTIKLIC